MGDIRLAFQQLLPDTLDMLQGYVLSRRIHSGQVIFSASSLSIFAALGVMLSLMEGFRHASTFPPMHGTFGNAASGPCFWCPSPCCPCPWLLS